MLFEASPRRLSRRVISPAEKSNEWKHHVLVAAICVFGILTIICGGLMMQTKKTADANAALSSSLTKDGQFTDYHGLSVGRPLPIPESARIAQIDLFHKEHAADEPIDTVFNPVFARQIGYRGSTNCHARRTARHLLAWAKIAEEENIPWMLFMGTLIGYARDKTAIPFDHDIDVAIPTWAYEKLKKRATKLPFHGHEWDDDTEHLWVYPFSNGTSLDKRINFDCDGNVAEEQNDFCGSYEPCARFELGGTGRRWNLGFIDIWNMDHIPNIQKAMYLNKLFEANAFFPMRPCTFMGVPAYCPNDIEAVLRAEYGPTLADLVPPRACTFGRWRKTNEFFFGRIVKSLLNKFEKERIAEFGESVMTAVPEKPIFYGTISCDDLANKWGVQEDVLYSACGTPGAPPPTKLPDWMWEDKSS